MLEVALIIINSKQACNFLKLQTSMLFSTLYTNIWCCFEYTLLTDNPAKQKGIYYFLHYPVTPQATFFNISYKHTN